MKRIILIMLMFCTIAFAQQRFKTNNGTTGTIVDTVTFTQPFWDFTVSNNGAVTDTLFIWQVGGTPTTSDKYPLTGGLSQWFKSSAPNKTIYLQGSASGIKRLIMIFY